MQNSLIKALRTADEVRDEEKLTSWFYQILRNAIVDHVRSRRAGAEREDAWATNAEMAKEDEVSKIACACVTALLEDLTPREAELVRRGGTR